MSPRTGSPSSSSQCLASASSAEFPEPACVIHNEWVTGRQTAEEILDNLRAAGHRAYFVGGCVRDLLLGTDPKDFDIATDAVPTQVLQLYPQSQQVGAHFGVLLVGGVEVATFRSEH